VANVLQQTKQAPPVMEGMGCTVAQGDRRCPLEKQYLHWAIFGRLKSAIGGVRATV
jgi:hypothetical protein